MQQETEDRIEAPVGESVEGGMKYTFSQMPQNAGELKTIVDFKDERYVMALFMASLVRLAQDNEDGVEMINVLRGPQPMSQYEISFVTSHLEDKKYLPQAYFEGAEPANNYQPDEPWTVIIYDDQREPAEEGYIRTFIRTSGADSSRYMTMRQKEGNWFVWEYPGIIMGIRLPAEEDPWQ